MKKQQFTVAGLVLTLALVAASATAQTQSCEGTSRYVVREGDSMWRLEGIAWEDRLEKLKKINPKLANREVRRTPEGTFFPLYEDEIICGLGLIDSPAIFQRAGVPAGSLQIPPLDSEFLKQNWWWILVVLNLVLFLRTIGRLPQKPPSEVPKDQKESGANIKTTAESTPGSEENLRRVAKITDKRVEKALGLRKALRFRGPDLCRLVGKWVEKRNDDFLEITCPEGKIAYRLVYITEDGDSIEYFIDAFDGTELRTNNALGGRWSTFLPTVYRLNASPLDASFLPYSEMSPDFPEPTPLDASASG